MPTTTSSTTRSSAQIRFRTRHGCASGSAWPKHRILFMLAGMFTLGGTVLAAQVNRWFALLPAVVGVNQLLLVATGWCPASAVLDRLLPSARRPAPDPLPQHSAL